MSAKHIAVAGGILGTPTSVTIDVYGEDGVLIATIPNADIVRVGSTQIYTCDVRASSVAVNLGLPPDGSHQEKRFTLVWKSDAGADVPTSELISGIQNLLAVDRRYRDEEITYVGLTKQMSHVKVELKSSPGAATPSETYYEIMSYDTLGRVVSRKTSDTPPA